VENKSVIDKLKLNEVSKLINQDPSYESIILNINSHRDRFENNIVMMSKFKELSYSEYLDYIKKSSNEEFILEINNKADSIANKKLEYYKPKIDSAIIEYRKIRDENDPSKYVKAEFSSVSKEGGFLIFKITPLKGTIRGVSFTYKIIYKPTNILDARNKRLEAEGACAGYISGEVIFCRPSQEVNLLFNDNGTGNIKEKYKFEYTYIDVALKDKTININSYKKYIPIIYSMYLDKDSLDIRDYYDVMRVEYNNDFGSSKHILFISEKEKINPLAFEFEQVISRN
jgi:hypothetical protein